MRKRWRWFFLSLLVLACAGAWFADRTLKHHGHAGLVTFCKQWWRNYPKSFAMDPPMLTITVDKKGMEELQGVVDRALDKGVIEEEGNNYVKADLAVNDEGAFKVKLRIKGKMTDHVEGKKWSFRVVVKKDGAFLGMKRFSLQHPGTRNYLCDWFYHRLMKGEGIIALRYGFCKVTLNDDDLGVYAYEEHFGPELLENNARMKGPIVRFDPSLFWQHRMNGLDGVHVDDAFGAYQAAALDAFNSDYIAKNPQQKKYFEEAIALMDAFRRGDLKASEVFDVDRIARQLAIIDLVGGQHSMDWSDVKFWFDPMTKRFQPISYESFSANPTKELAGAYRFTGPFAESDDLHTAFFKDPEIFAAYVHHLERISRKSYLDSAFTALKGPLDTASATMYGEFPYKELDRTIYYTNQIAIKRMLDVPKGFHAYTQAPSSRSVGNFSGDTLTLSIVPVNSIPMQVDSLELKHGIRVAPIGRAIVNCRERGKVGVPMEVRFIAPRGEKDVPKKGLKLTYRVLGAAVEKEMEVFPFTLRDAKTMSDSTAAPQKAK